MDLTPMHKRVIALDVHQAKITACAIVEHEDGRVEVTKRDFGAFKRDRRALAQWSLEIRPEVVVMESTGVYWKSPFAALEAVGIIAWVVNARHVKAVPGRKTDMADAQWLATLARAWRRGAGGAAWRRAPWRWRRCARGCCRSSRRPR